MKSRRVAPPRFCSGTLRGPAVGIYFRAFRPELQGRLLTQMAQTAVRNRHHSLDQQLCRWLLLSMDRLRGNELRMTQELIANMLGVRRVGVTEATVHLLKARLIQ